MMKSSKNVTCFVLIVAVIVAAQVFPAQAQTVEADTTAVAQTVRSFHEALAAGDSNAVSRLLAPDAIILESGAIETRKEYLSHHLSGDIEFAQAVSTRRGEIQVKVSGDVAWASSTSEIQGNFRKRAINLTGAELMVLSRTADGWAIRATHWSTRTRP
ncbi:MAG: nuclear transport factor 2 family protein [Desulfobulbus sp.]|nr:nuclear transport factor 2 family protein [Desulfobulbus sp.]